MTRPHAVQSREHAPCIPLTKTLLRKARSALDRPQSWLEVREMGIVSRAPLTYAERKIFLELRAFLTGEGMVVVDVGAADGIYTSVFAKMRSVAAVYAFEPLAASFAKLRKAVHDYDHVQCFNSALGDVNGQRALYEYSYSDASSFLKMEERQERLLPSSTVALTTMVDVNRLDDLVAGGTVTQPDLIKIDVQGYEDRVLRGAEATLERTRYCVIELSFVSMYEGSWLFDDAYEYMTDRGFALVAVAGPVAGPLGAAAQVDGVFRHYDA